MKKPPSWTCILAANVIILAVFLSGCTTSSRYLWSQGDKRYTAVSIKEWEHLPAGTKNSTIRVLLVHGMGNFPFGVDPNNKYKPNLLGCDTYTELEKKLRNWNNQPVSWRNAVVAAAVQADWSEFIKNSASYLHHKEVSPENYEFKPIADDTGKIVGFTFTRTFEAGPSGVGLKFYVANWGFGSACTKESNFGSWSGLYPDQPSYSSIRPGPVKNAKIMSGDISDFDQGLNATRQGMNKMLKLTISDWGLGDAALYLNKGGQSLKLPIDHALHDLLQEAETNPKDHIAIVTHSLGSAITLDVVRSNMEKKLLATQLSKDSAPAENLPAPLNAKIGQERRTNPANITFYMFANQYGLLKLGGQDPIKNLKDAFSELNLKSTGTSVQIFAFTDSNDLLSYPMNPKIPGVSTCNVYVHNPTKNLFVLYEPAEAHLNYESSNSVLKAMLDGPANVILPAKD